MGIGPLNDRGSFAACLAELLAYVRGDNASMATKYQYPLTNTSLQNEGLALINLSEEMQAYFSGTLGQGGGSPQPTSVTVTPSLPTLSGLGTTQQFTAVVKDQNGNVLTPGVNGVPALVWSSSNLTSATVNASTGLVTVTGNGTTVILATCGTRGGGTTVTTTGASGPLVPTTLTISPTNASLTAVGQQQQYTAIVLDQNSNPMSPGVGGVPALVWSSLNTAAATINSSTGLATEAGNGTATIKCTCGSAGNTVTLTCSGGPGGGGPGPNVPPGITVTIDTGKMIGTPANSTNGTWQTSNNGVTNVWTNFGQNPTYLLPAPGSGIRQKYDSTVPGGGNAVTFGTPMAQVNCNVLYLKAKVRFVNWSITGAAGTKLTTSCPKLMEPRCGGPGNAVSGQENHVLNTTVSSTGDTYLWFSKQINAGANNPTGGSFENYVRMDVAPFSDVSLLTPKGALDFAAATYQMVEYIITFETVTGSSNDARVQEFVGGVASYDSLNQGVGGGDYGPQGGFNLLATNSVRQWWYLLFNSTYGGAAANNGPATTMYYDVDEIYAGYK